MTDREKLDDLFADGKCPAWFVDNKQRLDTVDYLIANGVTVNEWISVEERLPEKNSAVIVCTRTENVFQALYRYDGWDLLEAIAANITHWMPLPNPPKEVE